MLQVSMMTPQSKASARRRRAKIRLRRLRFPLGGERFAVEHTESHLRGQDVLIVVQPVRGLAQLECTGGDDDV